MARDQLPSDVPLAHVNGEAETVANWAYESLLKGPLEFPFDGVFEWSAKEGLKPWRKKKANRGGPKSKRLDNRETHKRILMLKKKVDRAMEEAGKIIACGVGLYLKTGQSIPFGCPADELGSWLAVNLRDTILRANRLLLQLAERNNPHAVDALARCSLAAAIELENLTRRNLALVSAVARKLSCWPVAYSPHKDTQSEAQAMMERLGVGHEAPENVWGDWSNTQAKRQPYRHVLGDYAARMMSMLQTLNGTELYKRLLTGIRTGPFHHKYELTSQDRARLIQLGWPNWILDAAFLPKFSNESATDWFEVGWAALKEAAGGSAAKIPELRPVGASRAKVWGDFSTALQERQREQQIRERLREIFLKRFKFTR